MKETVSSLAFAVDAAEVAVLDLPSSPIPPSVSSDPLVPDDDAAQLSGVRVEIICQVQSLFDSFAKLLEACFTSIDNRFSQVISSAASNVVDDGKISDNVSQDVIIHSFSVSPAVAGEF